MDKKEIKTHIAKKLRWSNKELWRDLSENEQNAVVDEYYHSSDIEKVGIQRVLEANRGIQRDFALLVIGTLLGILGGMAGNIALKYFPETLSFDVLFGILFIIFVVFLFRSVDQVGAENLQEDRVLEHLLESVRTKESGTLSE